MPSRTPAIGTALPSARAPTSGATSPPIRNCDAPSRAAAVPGSPNPIRSQTHRDGAQRLPPVLVEHQVGVQPDTGHPLPAVVGESGEVEGPTCRVQLDAPATAFAGGDRETHLADAG